MDRTTAERWRSLAELVEACGLLLEACRTVDADPRELATPLEAALDATRRRLEREIDRVSLELLEARARPRPLEAWRR